jgi:hypothetical protein
MSNSFEEVQEFPLSGTKNGKIEVAIIREPYGEGSDAVASIGVFLESANSEPDWKVHIPKEDIEKVIKALQEAKERL